MKMKYLKTLIVLATLFAISSLSFASGSNIARMNAGVGDMTLSTNGLEAVYVTAQARPGMDMMLGQMLGQDWQGNLEVVDSWVVPVGTKFINSGLDKRGIPTQWEQTAKKSFLCFRIRNRVNHKVVLIKDNCLNPVNRIPAVPMSRRELVETSIVTEVDFDVSLEVSIDFNPTVTSTATASTAPINITINNMQAAAPLMMMGGIPTNQFVVFRDARNYLSIGWLVGGGTRINVQNTNINTNMNSNVNTNTNTNSNVNTNTINVGGCGEEPHYNLSAEVGIMPTPQLFSDNKLFTFIEK